MRRPTPHGRGETAGVVPHPAPGGRQIAHSCTRCHEISTELGIGMLVRTQPTAPPRASSLAAGIASMRRRGPRDARRPDLTV
jgi:hypothetical protein